MSLKCHAKELKGIGSMAIFNVLCKVCCQVRQSCSFSLKTDQYSIHWRNADVRLVEINEEMSKLLGGQG